MKQTFNKMGLAALALASVLALSACGGGGGGSNNNTPTTGNSGSGSGSSGGTTSSTTVSGNVSLLTPAASAASAFASVGDPAADSLAYVNLQRAAMSLPVLTQIPAIATAAQNHSTYLFDNTETGHYETAGLPGYTENSPDERIQAVYPTTATGEVLIAYLGVVAFPTTYQPIEALFEAPFHRAVMLNEYLGAGVGYKQSGSTTQVSSLVMDFGGQNTVTTANQLVAYPYNGQTDANTSWYVSESPSPMEFNTAYNNTTVGYPVLLTAGLGSSLTVASFTITDASGTNVPCQEIDASVEAEAAGMAICTPFAELNPSTTYTVAASGTVTKGGTTQAYSVKWSFTTIAARDVPMDSPSRLTTSTVSSASTSSGAGVAVPASSTVNAPSMSMATPVTKATATN